MVCSRCANNKPDDKYQTCEKCRLRSRKVGLRQTLAKFNLEPWEHARILADQGYKCAICGDPESRLVIDHDHKTEVFRGLLCDKCNSGLGFFRDSPELLNRAIWYLMKRKKRV